MFEHRGEHDDLPSIAEAFGRKYFRVDNRE